MNGKVIKEAYTFDDLLLVPSKSSVVPAEVSVKTKLTKKITLNVPIISAAMDTVTEDKMATMLAKLGGIGFIHKNMPLELQAELVKNVKDAEIEDFLAHKELNLHPTNDTAVAYKDAEYVVVATPTNYDPDKNYFDTSSVEKAIDSILEVNKDVTIIIKM